MTKATTVQARIDSDLKKKAEAVFKKVGLTASQAINAMYAQVVLQKGIPFELKVPNKSSIKAMKELESGDGKIFNSFKEVLDDAKK